MKLLGFVAVLLECIPPEANNSCTASLRIFFNIE